MAANKNKTQKVSRNNVLRVIRGKIKALKGSNFTRVQHTALDKLNDYVHAAVHRLAIAAATIAHEEKHKTVLPRDVTAAIKTRDNSNTVLRSVQ